VSSSSSAFNAAAWASGYVSRGGWPPVEEARKIENFRFHDLRHTAGTRLAEAGADAFTIKDILGHASIQTSVIYVHATDQGKRRAISALDRYAEKLGHKLATNEKEQTEQPALNH
jgi:integrase